MDQSKIDGTAAGRHTKTTDVDLTNYRAGITRPMGEKLMMEYWDQLIKAMLDGITITIKVERNQTDDAIKEDINTSVQTVTAVCDYCGWTKSYSTTDSADRALRAHQQHCSKIAVDTSWITAMTEKQKIEQPEQDEESQDD